MSDIFISYRHNGGFPTANHIYEKLKKDGYNVCFDKSSLKQGKFDEKISDQIEGCTDFIVVLDKEAFKRTLNSEPLDKDWLRRELAHAIKHKKNIIPVMLSGFEWPDHLPSDIDEVRKHNGPEYSRSYFNEFYKKLTSFLKTRTPLKKHLRRIILPFLLLISIVAGCFWFWNSHYKTLKDDCNNLRDTVTQLSIENKTLTEKMNEPVLLLVGGGSVYGYIHNCIDSTIMDKYVYVPMASKAAWPLIKEERSIGPMIQKEITDEKHSYYLVLFSGKKAEDSCFIEKEYKKDFLDRIGYVAEIEIGKSHLQVAISDTTRIPVPNSDSISSTELRQLLLNYADSISIFTTNKESATWNSYDRLLNHYLSNNEHQTLVFYRNSPRWNFSEKEEDKPFVILESLTYSAKKADVQNKLKVYDDKTGKSSYPLYVYFVVYKDGDNYAIPKAARSFFADINIKLPENWTTELSPPDKDNLIYVYDTLIHKVIKPSR